MGKLRNFISAQKKEERYKIPSSVINSRGKKRGYRSVGKGLTTGRKKKEEKGL